MKAEQQLPEIQDRPSHDASVRDADGSNVSEKTLSPPEHEQDVERSPPKAVEDVPPDGGYGWVCVVCCALINAHTWGLNSSYGVFLAHYLATDTYPGATALEFAFIGGLSIAMSQVVAPLCTVITRRYGTHATLSIGIVLQTAALLGASWSADIWQLFLSQGVCFGFGMGFQFNASVGIVPQWFQRKRSFANSVAAAGSGFGGLVYSLAANAIIQSMGVSWAFRILAIVSAAVNSLCALLVRDRNKLVGSTQIAFDWSLFRRPQYILTLAWGCFSIMGYVVLLFSLPAYATTIGLSAEQGSIIGAVLNLGQGVGRPFIGLSSDKFGRINMALLGTLLPALFVFALWIPAKSYGLMIFFSLIAGMFIGTFWTVVGPVTAEVVGLKHLPSALSIFWPTLILPSLFAEPIALELRRPDNGSGGGVYLNAQVFSGFMYVGATLCLWFVRAWKLREVQRVAAEAAAEGGVLGGEARETVIRDDDAAGAVGARPALSRTTSVRSRVEEARGLWAWVKV